MEVRYFQIIIPIISLLFMYVQYREYTKNKASINETVLLGLFWLAVTCLAIFPDVLSGSIANVFGIEDNINATVFFALGLLFYLQFKMYKRIKRQDELITKLSRKIALDNIKNK